MRVHICMYTASEKVVSTGLTEKWTCQKFSGRAKGDSYATSAEEHSRQRQKP